MFHTDSEKFSHVLCVLNVLLADRCALSLAFHPPSGQSGRMAIRSEERRAWLSTTTAAWLLVACLVASLASCGSASSGDPAVWAIQSDSLPSESSTTFTAYVRRLGCNGGVTGDVLKPNVKRSVNAIVVTFRVAAVSGLQLCPANRSVPVVVNVGEPIGSRILVDGACSADATAKATASCDNGGTRWNP
ncbi:unannotated protein [freshwater metagenome]|uniref:Unannotated protein n=1 Tax=freshwater metagenome TaxID=449393 RepID=A0A6J6WP31_9ZZZZ